MRALKSKGVLLGLDQIVCFNVLFGSLAMNFIFVPSLSQNIKIQYYFVEYKF